MDEEQGPRPIRVVLAAPFPEIVGLHEKVAEFADRLDVCGAVMDADGAVDQARILEPDVVILSDHLAGIAALPGRLAATRPATPIVVMRSDGGPELPAVAATIAAGATGSELHDAITRLLEGRLHAGPGHLASPENHEDAPGHEMPTWFWQSPAAAPSEPPAPLELPVSDPGPVVAASSPPVAEPPPVEPPATSEAEPAVGTEDEPIPPRDERPSWPPPWFRLAAEEEARREVDAAARRDAEEKARVEAERLETERAAREQAARDEAAREEAARVERERAETIAREAAARAERERAEQARADEAEVAARNAADDARAAEAAIAPDSAAAAAPSLSDRLEPAPPHYERVELPPMPEPAVFGAVAPAEAPHEAPAPPEAHPAEAAAAAAAPAEQPAAPTRAPLPRRTSGRAETVLVFSGKGGVGSSVVATNLAVALARRGSSVAIVDLNLQYGDVAVMLHLEGHAMTVESLAQQGDQLDRESLDEVLATGPEGVRALLAPASPEFADLVTAASLRAIFRELGRAFDYVIIDSASHLEELVLEVMEIADRILVVTAYAIASVKDTKVTLKLLQSLGIEHDRISVVLNQTKQKVSFPPTDIEKSLNFGILAQLPFDARIDDTIDTGAPMTMTQPKSDFSRRIGEIADSLAPPDPASPASAARRRFGFRR